MEKAKRIFGLLLVLSISTGILSAQSEEVKELRNISFQILENQLNVLMEFDEGIVYESFTLFNPNRLVVDLINAEKISAEPLHEVNSYGVLRIRAAINRPSTIRVVVDFEDELPLYRIQEVDIGLEISFWREEPEEITEITPPLVIKEEIKKPEEKPEEVEEKEEKIEPEPKIEEIRKITRAELTEKEKIMAKSMSLGILTGFYFMHDEAFQQIYGNSSFFFGGEYSFAIPVKELKRRLDACISFKHMQKTGITSYTEEELNLKITHISISLRYLIYLNRFMPYIGPGIDYITYKETYPETFPIESVGGSDIGFHIQGGCYFHLTQYLSARTYFKYNISKTLSEDITVNLGGTEWGIGLVFRF